MKHSIERKEGFEINGNVFYNFIEVYPNERVLLISKYFKDAFHIRYTDLMAVDLYE